MNKAKYVVMGCAVGMALVIACAHMNAGTDAGASPNDCATWQLGLVSGTYDSGPPKNWALPQGWEPLALYGSGSGSDGYVWARRCAP